MVCLYCGKPIEWDTYWATWDHTDARKLTAQLCDPALGWKDSTYALPKR